MELKTCVRVAPRVAPAGLLGKAEAAGTNDKDCRDGNSGRD